MKKNIMLICGGGYSEHEISLVSARYLLKNIDDQSYNVFHVVIEPQGNWSINNQQVHFQDRTLTIANESFTIDLAIPYFHGRPGESGEFQSYLELKKLPYLGSDNQGSLVCFNKMLTKLALEHFGIKTVPFITLMELEMPKAESFFEQHEKVFVKASNQGSSIGCYPVHKSDQLEDSIKAAFNYSDTVLIEKMVTARELEVAVYEYQGNLIATDPGEISCPTKFYSFEEKYKQSQTQTIIKAKDLQDDQILMIKEISLKAFKALLLRDFARIDFFLCEDGQIFINEINTHPGLTPISMFPQMLENTGLKFKDFIMDRIAHRLS